MDEQFVMSMYAKKEDLYKAKAEYYMQQLKDLQEAVMVMIDSGEGTKYHYEVDGSTVDAVLEVLKKQEVE